MVLFLVMLRSSYAFPCLEYAPNVFQSSAILLRVYFVMSFSAFLLAMPKYDHMTLKANGSLSEAPNRKARASLASEEVAVPGRDEDLDQ